MNLLKSRGEPGSLAAKEQMIVNHSLLPFTEINALSTCIIRKIDAIVTDIKKERIELSNNEWKKSCASEDTVMKQKSKNLRTNLSILTQLNRRYNIKTKNVLAMDFIGKYLLKRSSIFQALMTMTTNS